MRIAGAAICEWRLRILHGVSGLMDAIHREDQPVKILAAGGLHTSDFIDVIRGVTPVGRAERAGEICRDRVAIVVFQHAQRRWFWRMTWHWSRTFAAILTGCAATGGEKFFRTANTER